MSVDQQAYMRAYRQRPEAQEKRRQYATDNAARIRELDKARHRRHRDKRLEYQREYARTHAAEAAARHAAWTLENRDRIREGAWRRRAQKHGATAVDFTHADWLDLLREHDGRCVYCQRSDVELTVDHDIPLRRNGQHTKSNIVPACRSCNVKKKNLTGQEFREKNNNA